MAPRPGASTATVPSVSLLQFPAPGKGRAQGKGAGLAVLWVRSVPWGNVLCKHLSTLIPRCQAAADSSAAFSCIVGVLSSISIRKTHSTWQTDLFFSISETSLEAFAKLSVFLPEFMQPKFVLQEYFQGEKRRKSHTHTWSCREKHQTPWGSEQTSQKPQTEQQNHRANTDQRREIFRLLPSDLHSEGGLPLHQFRNQTQQ